MHGRSLLGGTCLRARRVTAAGNRELEGASTSGRSAAAPCISAWGFALPRGRQGRGMQPLLATGATPGDPKAQPESPSHAPQPQPSSSSSSNSSGDSSPSISASATSFSLRPIHVISFLLIFLGGALFATLTLHFTADMEFAAAASTVLRRVTKSVAFRQLALIASAICIMRFGFTGILKALSKFTSSTVAWDKTKIYYVMKEVYQPLELLLFVAALCTIADSFVPSLISVPKPVVSHVVRSILSSSFIIGFASVVLNLKARFCKENAWQAEMKGDLSMQRRWEAYDKLGNFAIYVMTFVLGIQAIGLDITSILAIGGIGGLAIGLAGREICENLLNGFLIMFTSPFEVGEEVHFFHSNKIVEGLVMEIGWYRTTIRSFEREVFVIPNAVFSKNIVLNISRKKNEWRFFETLYLRVQDVQKAAAICQDIRRIVRNDSRVNTSLHRRVFLDKVTTADCRIYISFYLTAANRENFMGIKQDLLLSFIDVIERNGAKLAQPRTVVDMDPEVSQAMGTMNPMLSMALAQSYAVQNGGGKRQITDGAMVTDVAVQPMGGSSSKGSGGGSSGSKSGSGGGSAAAVPVGAVPVSSMAAATSPPTTPTKVSASGKASGTVAAVPAVPPSAAPAVAFAGGNNVVSAGVSSTPLGNGSQPGSSPPGSPGKGDAAAAAAVAVAAVGVEAAALSAPAAAALDVLPPSPGQSPRRQTASRGTGSGSRSDSESSPILVSASFDDLSI